MARNFDGTDDQADAGNQSVLNPVSAISVFTWHNPNGDNDTGDGQALIDDRNEGASNQNGYVLAMRNNAGGRTLRFFLYDTAFRGGGTFSLTFGTLKAIGATWSKSSGDMDVYADGVVKDTFSSLTSDIVYTNPRFAIGRSFKTSGAEFCDAIISFTTIWNVKLTDNHMAALNRGVYPMFVSSDKPVGHFPLWGNESPEADYTSNNATLTLVGTTKTSNPPIELFENYL